MAMKYDPSTGTWSSAGGNLGNSDPGVPAPTSTPKSSFTAKASTAKGQAKKKSYTIEYNILKGQLKVLATKDTITLTAGDTVNLFGLGKYLSGKYFIEDVTREVSRSGYSHTFNVLKPDFGKSLKSGLTIGQACNLVHFVQKGETLWSLAKRYYGSGKKWPLIAQANNIDASFTNKNGKTNQSKWKKKKLPIGMRLFIP